MMGIYDETPPESRAALNPTQQASSTDVVPQRVLCRVGGLASAAGKLLNGRTGYAQVTPKQLAIVADNDRIPVLIDGEDAAKLLKKLNLEFATTTRDVSNAGFCTVTLNPFGRSALTFLSWGSSGPTKKKLAMLDQLETTQLPFENIDELPVVLQFLLSCGPVPDLERAQSALSRIASPELLLEHAEAANRRQTLPPGAPPKGGLMVAGTQKPADVASLIPVEVPSCTRLSEFVIGSGVSGLGQLRAPGVGLTALEWAAKWGHAQIVEWLCTDERSALLTRIGSAVGWACYEGHVGVARYLCEKGASPRATDSVFWRGLPPILAAASKGQQRAVAFLCEEQNVSIKTCDDDSLGILHHIHGPDDWQQRPNYVATDEYAQSRGAKKQHFRNFTTK